MPELPEVETTCDGIRPFLINQTISDIIVRQNKLRLPVTENIAALTTGKTITSVSRRSKYLIIQLSSGFLLIHLGMSGHLRVITGQDLPKKHDHIDLCLDNDITLRYNDPRRFGLWIYDVDSPQSHRLLSHLGPEPLTDEFNEDYLYEKLKNRKKPIKSLIMDNEIVVGVGNIYATESLFLSGIHPLTPANKISKPQSTLLTQTIKQVLAKAIKAGGTTLRDFYAADGKPGYFVNELKIYGCKGKPCPACKTEIKARIIGGRNTTFCPQCQR